MSIFSNLNKAVSVADYSARCLALCAANEQLYFLCGESLCSWDLKSESYEILAEQVPWRISHLAVNDDASQILLVSNCGLHVYDQNRGTILFAGDLCLPPEDQISAFSVSPDFSVAAVASYCNVGIHYHSDVHLRLWSLIDLEPIIDLSGHQYPVTDALFQSNGQILVTSSAQVGDHGRFAFEPLRYRIWSINDGVCINSFGGEKRFDGHKSHSEPWDRLDSPCLAVSPDGKHGLFTITSKHGLYLIRSQVALVDLKTWRTVRLFDTGAERVEGAQFSKDGAHVFALGDNQVFYSWNKTTGAIEKLIGGCSAYSKGFIVMPDNSSVITTHSDKGNSIHNRYLFLNESEDEVDSDSPSSDDDDELEADQ